MTGTESGHMAQSTEEELSARDPALDAMTARRLDLRRLSGPQACCDPGYARAVPEHDGR